MGGVRGQKKAKFKALQTHFVSASDCKAATVPRTSPAGRGDLRSGLKLEAESDRDCRPSCPVEPALSALAFKMMRKGDIWWVHVRTRGGERAMRCRCPLRLRQSLLRAERSFFFSLRLTRMFLKSDPKPLRRETLMAWCLQMVYRLDYPRDKLQHMHMCPKMSTSPRCPRQHAESQHTVPPQHIVRRTNRL